MRSTPKVLVYRFALLMALLLCTGRASAQLQLADPADPSLFHFFKSEHFLYGPSPGGSPMSYGCINTSGRIRSIKFGEYIYMCWVDSHNGVMLACVGSTHLKELVAGGAVSSTNVIDYSHYQQAYSLGSPCLAVYRDTLRLLYMNYESNVTVPYSDLWCIDVGVPGTLPVNARNYPMPGNVVDITDISAVAARKYHSGSNQQLVITGRNPNNSHIRTLIYSNGGECGTSAGADMMKTADVTSIEQSNSFIGIQPIDTSGISGYYVAWAGTDAGHHLNTSSVSRCGIIESAMGSSGSVFNKFSYPDRSSCSGGVELFIKDGAPIEDIIPYYDEIHMLWRGDCGDATIYQGVFGACDRENFPQYQIDPNIARCNVAPTMVSLNAVVSYMMWPDVKYTPDLGNYQLQIAKAFDYKNSAWMANMVKDEQTLTDLTLPGSHNAGMNDVQQVGNNGDFYKLAQLPDFGHCNECGFVTQNLSIASQLDAGYRYFGMNITNSIYSQGEIGQAPYTPDGDSLHSGIPSVDGYSSICIGEGVRSTLDAVRDFLTSNPKELVILNIKDLIPATYSTTSIETYLNNTLPSYKNILYQPQAYEHSLADIVKKPIGGLRGKLIITMTDSATASHLHLLRDIFDVSLINDNHYHDHSTNAPEDLARDQTDFFRQSQFNGAYKRLDWYTDIAAQRIACSLKPDLDACSQHSQPGFWHHISHVIACTDQVYELTETVEEALDGNPFAFATVLGWTLSRFTGTSMEHAVSVNKLLYPTVYDLSVNAPANSDKINIIYSDVADALYTDLAVKTMYKFSDPAELSVYNGAIKVVAQVLPTTCSDTASGAASVQVSGGNPPYKYFWEISGDTTAYVSHLTEGHHKVRIKDALGHVVTKKVYVPLYENTHSGIAMRDTFKTEIQPLGLSNYYEAGCDGLVARIESNYSTSAVYDIVTARVWIDSNSNGMQARRHYQILPARDWANTSGRITLYYTQADFDNYNAANPVFRLPEFGGDVAGIANLFVQHRGGPGKDLSGKFASYPSAVKEIFPHAGDVVWNDIAGRWEVSFNTQSFGGFFISTCDASLQNTWLDANAYMQDKMPLITWQVQEKNIARYEVEYSYDGSSFMTAGVLDSKGHGRNDYQLAHNVQLPVGRINQQVIFYRIRQTDNEGTSQLSRILPVYIGGTAVLAVYPNPFSSTLNITSNTEMPAILCDITGKIVLRLQLRKGNIVVDQGALTPGLYILKTQEGQCYKVVKNR